MQPAPLLGSLIQAVLGERPATSLSSAVNLNVGAGIIRMLAQALLAAFRARLGTSSRRRPFTAPASAEGRCASGHEPARAELTVRVRSLLWRNSHEEIYSHSGPVPAVFPSNSQDL